MKILFRAYFHKKNFRKKLAENLLGSGSRSGSGRFRKSDPDPVKNCLGQQQCSWGCEVQGEMTLAGIFRAFASDYYPLELH
jgi:hypothetical protein